MIKILVFLATLLVANAEPVLNYNNTPFIKHGKYLISISTRLNYMQSYAMCKRYGYTLAMERSSDDTVQLNDAISFAGVGSYSFWMGGFRQNSGNFEPEWIWLETGDPIMYNRWSPDERIVRTCLRRWDLSCHGGTWLSEDCTANILNFICQKYQC